MRIGQERVTRHNAREVKESVLAAVARGDDVLDFEGVAVVDSSAVSLVLSWRRRLQAQGRTPCLVNVPPKLGDLSRLYGLEGLVEPSMTE